ncbi:MAG: hypothetical protein JXN65_02595 [Clostridia bacterium]|nr:hypothetical protein [Clostridia bacterium]
MNDAVTTTKQIWEKLMEGDIKAFTISDIIFAVGLIVLAVLAIKIGYKMAKVLLVILLIGLIIVYLITKGIIPIG